MPRNGEKVHRRLQGAALELFRERGYDQTTVVEIAARAGVTERTFFRHFPDKREILFGGEPAMRAAMLQAITHAPHAQEPMQILLAALGAAEAILDDNRQFAPARQEVIAASPALKERELSKVAALIDVLAEGLVQRGVEARLALLAAHASIAVFNHALPVWMVDPTRPLQVHLVEAFHDLCSLSLAGASTTAPSEETGGTKDNRRDVN